MNQSKIFFSERHIKSAIKKIPSKDFIGDSYDLFSTNQVQTKGLLIILSTPRSGSTLVCDLLRKSEFCMAHEYFQMDEYLPLLASRWNCLEEGHLQKEKFIAELLKHRTMKSGWLGINLHGRHIPNFLEFKEHLPNLKSLFIRIRRRNIVKQAISYEIAKQTGKWSSEFDSGVRPTYSFESISKRIAELSFQNTIIDTYIEQFQLDVCELYYEEFIEDPKKYLASVLPAEYLNSDTFVPSLVRQRSKVNGEWEDRFNNEILSYKPNKTFLRRFIF